MNRIITRRAVVRMAAGAVAAVGAGSVPVTVASPTIAGVPWAATRTQITPFTEVEWATLVELRTALDTHQLSVRELVEQYLGRIAVIDGAGPLLRSVLELNRRRSPSQKPSIRSCGPIDAADPCMVSRSCSRTTSTPPTRC
jgi:hypothetical protein